jgi:hypothetical protein
MFQVERFGYSVAGDGGRVIRNQIAFIASQRIDLKAGGRITPAMAVLDASASER